MSSAQTAPGPIESSAARSAATASFPLLTLSTRSAPLAASASLPVSVTPAGAGTAGRWIPYVVVDDLDAATKQATTLGGSVIRDATTGPAGVSVLVADPSGAVVALFVPSAG